jgi:hypothetical protein
VFISLIYRFSFHIYIISHRNITYLAAQCDIFIRVSSCILHFWTALVVSRLKKHSVPHLIEFQSLKPKKLAQAIDRPTCFAEVPDSNLGWHSQKS